MAVVDLAKAREAEVSKKCSVIAGSVVMAMALFWAVMKPPQFVWADGHVVGGAMAAVFLFYITVGFFVCLGVVWFLLQGFPLEPFLGLVLVLWSWLFVACLVSVTDEFFSFGVSLFVSYAFVIFLIANRKKPEAQPQQPEDAPTAAAP